MVGWTAASVVVPSLPSPIILHHHPSLSTNLPHSPNIENGNGSEEEQSAHSYKWRLVIAYEGTRFSGWQYQKSPPTIQCLIEQALTHVTKLDRKDLCLIGASRTDAGVHAWGQVAHFATPFNYESLESAHAAMNGLLPPDIRVREFSAALPEFHARFSVMSKIYTYKIYNDATMDPFQRHYAYHSTYKLNTAAIREGAKFFVGEHNFSSFVNTSRTSYSPNPVKKILRFDVTEMGPLLQLEVEGSGFLYRQVRNMVALLLQIGREAVPPDIVPKILASCDRRELAKYEFFAIAWFNTLKEHLQLPAGCPPSSFGRHHRTEYKKMQAAMLLKNQFAIEHLVERNLSEFL